MLKSEKVIACEVIEITEEKVKAITMSFFSSAKFLRKEILIRKSGINGIYQQHNIFKKQFFLKILTVKHYIKIRTYRK